MFVVVKNVSGMDRSIDLLCLVEMSRSTKDWILLLVAEPKLGLNEFRRGRCDNVTIRTAVPSVSPFSRSIPKYSSSS